MTDLTLPLALILSVGLNVVFYARWRRAANALQPLRNECDAQRKRAWYAEDRLKDTEAALHAKVAAETRGGDGPVAA
jgi:hypothetical protein